jgi:hypothetical protein
MCGYGLPATGRTRQDSVASQWLIVRDNGSVRFAPPELPVMVSVALVGGFAVVPVLPPPQPHRFMRNRATLGITIHFVRPTVIPDCASRNSNANAQNTEISKRIGNCRTPDGSIKGIVITLVVLLIVTVNAKEGPFGTTDAGEMEQIDDPGAPAHASEIVPLKPLTVDT